MRLRALCSLTFLTVIGLAGTQLGFLTAQAPPRPPQATPERKTRNDRSASKWDW